MSRPVIGFAGMTHLGLNSAVASAERGFEVIGFDPDGTRIDALKRGEPYVVEPDLPELMAKNRDRLRFTQSIADLSRCQVIYVAPDVPTDDRGQSDLEGIHALYDQVNGAADADAVVIVLSQVPPGFTRALKRAADRQYYQVETLIFGRAVERALHPERFIIGCADPAAPLPPAYAEYLQAFGCPLLPMRYESAELAKISINCCLVASVTVANTLAELSESIGADWSEIVPALKLDRRIGQYSYLSPGLGLAGGNLERDLATVLRFSEATGSEASLISSFVYNSHHRRDWVLRTLHDELLAGKPDAVIGVLGLAYKENTHSTKNSPSLALLNHLHAWQVRLHDPVVPASAAGHPQSIECKAVLDVACGADALVIMTPWPAFRELAAKDIATALRGHTVIDPYRVLNAGEVIGAGLDYLTLGVPPMRAKGGAGHA